MDQHRSDSAVTTEPMDLDDNEENTPSSEVVATEAEDLEEKGGDILQSNNVPNNNGMEKSQENNVLQKSENKTFNETKKSLKNTVKCEVSLTRSNRPSQFRKEEDSKGRLAEASGMDGKSVLKNRGALPFQRTAPATSLTSVFSPTDDPEKFQSNQATSSDLVLSLEDTQDHETTESSIPDNTDMSMNQVQPVNLQNHQACGFDYTKPSPTPGDYKVEHSSDKHKQVNKLPVNLQEEPTKSTTTHADHKTQQARSSDQDNVCCQPSASQEASVESHQTKLEAQKKQKGTDADVEEKDTHSDGRPSVEDKGTTPLTEGPVNLTLQTYYQNSMSKMSISLSAGSRQNGYQPVTIQRDPTEKWPTESSSDSE